jgi:uncharacterized membrane protein
VREFVEECRREWKRLGVPDPVANEMAADLEADLAEAEAEGASAEEVLGSGAFDPRSFAAAWAAERGVIQVAPPDRQRHPRRSRLAVAIAVFSVIAIVGAVLAIFGSAVATQRVAVASVVPGRQGVLVPPRLGFGVPPGARVVGPRLVLPSKPGSGVQVFKMDVGGSHVDLRPVGLLLMVVGIVGVILSMLYRSRRRTSAGDGTGF